MVTHHRVRDYSTWRSIYDGDAARRKSMGIKDWKVGQKPDDPNEIYMLWEVEDPKKIEGMMNDPELKTLMEKAGVVSPPEMILVLNEGK